MIKALLGRHRAVPLLLQSEISECSLACVAMIAAYHGYDCDLPTLRHKHQVTAAGANLRDLIELAGKLGLGARAFKGPIEALARVRLPAILHWDFEHFVVLVEVRGNRLVIHDPARGRRVITVKEASASFTGVIVELTPDVNFRSGQDRYVLPLRKLLHGSLPDTGPIWHGLCLALVTQVLSLLVPLLGQFLIDTVAKTRNVLDINIIGLSIGILAVAIGVAHFARGLTFVFLGSSLHRHLTHGLMQHLIDLPFSFFQRQHFSELVSRFDSLRVIQRVVSATFAESIVDGLTLIFATCLVAIYSWHLALVGVACMSLYAVARILMHRSFVVFNEEQIITGSRVQTSFIETVRAIESVKAHNGRQSRLLNWNTLLTRWFDATGRAQAQIVMFSALATTVQFLNLGSALWLGARLASIGTITLGELIACISLLQVLAYRFVALSDKVADFRMLDLHRARLSDIYAVPPEQLNGQSGATDNHVQGELVLNDVWFRYGKNQEWILKGANLHIAAGDFVAVTGKSGAGKSTLLRILLGLLDPEVGHVGVDGKSMATHGKAALRDRIAVVLQSDVLFTGSVAQNITSFDPLPDIAFMHECASRAGIHDDIERLVMGYHTPVGDTTSLLSGGQQQRVFLARALYRRPAILFLDEATSHLDVQKEVEINTRIAELGITRIVFAHRLETIRAAKRVITLSQGALEEHSSNYSGEHGKYPTSSF